MDGDIERLGPGRERGEERLGPGERERELTLSSTMSCGNSFLAAGTISISRYEYNNQTNRCHRGRKEKPREDSSLHPF